MNARNLAEKEDKDKKIEKDKDKREEKEKEKDLLEEDNLEGEEIKREDDDVILEKEVVRGPERHLLKPTTLKPSILKPKISRSEFQEEEKKYIVGSVTVLGRKVGFRYWNYFQ